MGKIATCFDCHWAFLDSDISVGIWPHLEECGCLDVPADLEEYIYDLLEAHNLWDDFHEVLPRKCGHFLNIQKYCIHNEDEMGICWECGAIVNEFKLKEYERLHQYSPITPEALK